MNIENKDFNKPIYINCGDEEYFDLPQRGDLVTVNGFTGEIIKAFGTEVEVLFGGDALHNCVEEHDLANAVYDGKGWVLSYEN